MKGLNHPHIVRLIHIVKREKYLYEVMEYVSSENVYDYVKRKEKDHKKIEEEEARNIFQQMASALHYLHKKGIVHR